MYRHLKVSHLIYTIFNKTMQRMLNYTNILDKHCCSYMLMISWSLIVTTAVIHVTSLAVKTTNLIHIAE